MYYLTDYFMTSDIVFLSSVLIINCPMFLFCCSLFFSKINSFKDVCVNFTYRHKTETKQIWYNMKSFEKQTRGKQHHQKGIYTNGNVSL